MMTRLMLNLHHKTSQGTRQSTVDFGHARRRTVAISLRFAAIRQDETVLTDDEGLETIAMSSFDKTP